MRNIEFSDGSVLDLDRVESVSGLLFSNHFDYFYVHMISDNVITVYERVGPDSKRSPETHPVLSLQKFKECLDIKFKGL